MCNPTFPIFRSASVLSATGNATPEQSVEVGRLLEVSSSEFIGAAKSFIEEHCPKLTDVSLKPGEVSSRPRVRLYPAIIVDFPVLQLMWRGLPLESRIGITTWVGERKAKLWLRFNFLEEVHSSELVKEFFAEISGESRKVRKFCLERYNELIQEKGFSLEDIFEISISMVSSPNPKILRVVDKRTEILCTDLMPEVRDAVLQIFKKEFDIELPAAVGGKRYAEAYVFPLIDPRLMARRRGLAPSEFKEMISREISPLDSLQAIVLIDTSDDRAEIWGLVHEKEPLNVNGVSGPLVVSGELSLELGGLY